MALLARKFYEYCLYIETLQDDRTRHLPLIDSKLGMAAILIAYGTFIKYIGPIMMKNRKPYNLQKVLIVYNVIQILANSFMFLEGLRMFWPIMSFTCSRCEMERNERTAYIGFLFWLYSMIKITDLLDTVFFVLKKNYRQVTFLHVYHHGGMALAAWLCTRYVPGGHPAWVGIINSLVHTIMYSYYLLTVLKPQYKNNHSVKKFITQIQLVQFAFFMCVFIPVVAMPNCNIPKLPSWAFLAQNSTMMWMFSDFYYKTYIRKQRQC